MENCISCHYNLIHKAALYMKSCLVEKDIDEVLASYLNSNTKSNKHGSLHEHCLCYSPRHVVSLHEHCLCGSPRHVVTLSRREGVL